MRTRGPFSPRTVRALGRHPRQAVGGIANHHAGAAGQHQVEIQAKVLDRIALRIDGAGGRVRRADRHLRDQRIRLLGVRPYRLAAGDGVAHLEGRARVGLGATERIQVGHDQIRALDHGHIGAVDPLRQRRAGQAGRRLVVQREQAVKTVSGGQRLEPLAMRRRVRQEHVETGQIDAGPRAAHDGSGSDTEKPSPVAKNEPPAR